MVQFFINIFDIFSIFRKKDNYFIVILMEKQNKKKYSSHFYKKI